MIFPVKQLVLITLLLILTTSCSQSPLALHQLPSILPNFSSNADFQIRVTPSERGVYTVSGTTNLPNESRITVAAIRILRPDKPSLQNLTPNQTYAILAYQDVKVNKGTWQTNNFNLWKVAPSGQFQEAWQIEQSQLGISLESEPNVTFLATVAPTSSLSELESQLEKQGVKLVSNLVRNTVDGERYIQASQVLQIALPTERTKPPLPKPEDINGGWGNRFLLIPEPPNINNYEKPDKRRTTAPLSPSEYLQ